jgi:hypothetical protein
MEKLHLVQTVLTPEIKLSPGENQFFIRGTSSPEDVRGLYYPVIEWIKIFIDDALEGSYKKFNKENPLLFQIDLSYFNSSSAKFIFDILTELKRLPQAGIPVQIHWYYDEEDLDMKEAGADISILVDMEFTYLIKPIGN